MTKVISLSEKAYGTLKKLKRSNESFSDLVLRIAGVDEKRSILEFAGTWKGSDIETVFSEVLKDRERSSSRRFEESNSSIGSDCWKLPHASTSPAPRSFCGS
jgi:predicted CopG family antitoxin